MSTYDVEGGKVLIKFVPDNGEGEKPTLKKPSQNKSSGSYFFWVISYIAFLLFCYFLASKGSFENLLGE